MGNIRSVTVPQVEREREELRREVEEWKGKYVRENSKFNLAYNEKVKKYLKKFINYGK